MPVPPFRTALSLAVALLAAPALLAEEPASRVGDAERQGLSMLSAGSDLLDTVPLIAFFDGSWSAALHLGTLLSNRTWDAPQPRGLAAHLATRVLYCTSWSTMIALEAMAAALAAGGRFDWLAEAEYRTDWLAGGTLAACTGPGSGAGCGIGLGGYGGVHVRPVGSRFWFEVTGGWLEQRVRNDASGTLAESIWVLAPMTVTRELETNRHAPLALRARAGPGLYFGMHNAHFHPAPSRAAGPWHELHPLELGAGPGGRADLRLVLLEKFSLGVELTAAALALSRSYRRAPELGAPFDEAAGDGLSTFRMIALGASVEPDDALPVRLGAAWFAAELSRRPITRFGHRGGMLRFEFPLRIERLGR